jgi:CelD/BcsL family acetyltransferase involved in cellulose biosynthesis
MATTEVTIHRGLPGLEVLRKDWDALRRRCGSWSAATLFSWQWAHASHLCTEPESLLFVQLRRDGVTRGILPLLSCASRRAGLQWRTLVLVSHPHVQLPDLLLDPAEDLAAWFNEIVHALRAAGIGFSFFEWRGIGEDSVALRATRALGERAILGSDGWSSHFDCSEGYASVSARYSPGLARTLKRGRNAGARLGAGDLRLHVALSGDERAAALQSFMRLEAGGWKGASGTQSAIGMHPPLTRFYTTLFADPAWSAESQINVLRLDGADIAAQLCVRSGPWLQVVKIAYDESFSRLAPGSLLLELLLRQACEQGDVRHVSLVTGATWHEPWGPRKMPVYDATLIPGRLARLAARTALRWTRWRNRSGGAASAANGTPGS